MYPIVLCGFKFFLNKATFNKGISNQNQINKHHTFPHQISIPMMHTATHQSLIMCIAAHQTIKIWWWTLVHIIKSSKFDYVPMCIKFQLWTLVCIKFQLYTLGFSLEIPVRIQVGFLVGIPVRIPVETQWESTAAH